MPDTRFSLPVPNINIPVSKPEIILSGFGMSLLRTSVLRKSASPSDKPILPNSYLGTPVFDGFTFEAGAYILNGKTITYLNKPFTLSTVLIEVQLNKNIIKTAIQGRDGTVKEYISMDDYSIDIKGVLTSKNAGSYPEDDVNTLIRICQAPCALKVTSGLLSLFGVTEIVIDPSMSLVQSEGQRNSQLFRISAISDTPLELIKNA